LEGKERDMARITQYPKLAITLLAIGVTLFLVLSFACGGDDDDNGSDGGATSAPAENGNGGDGTYDVSMTDDAYIPADFTVPAGGTLTLNLTNDGTAIHNVRVSGADGEYNTDDDAVSVPDLVQAGGTGTVTWEAPEDPGEFLYKCDIHPDLGGTITVE
jgi:plastocyanin